MELSPAANGNYYCTDTDQSLINKIISRYPKLFSGDLGCFNKFKVKLYQKPNTKPMFFKARPVAFALKDKINKEIDRLLMLGVLKPVEYSHYASPIVPALKKDGSIRLCADFSASINKQLIIEKYPLPTIDELFSKLHGGEEFTKLDLSMAYNQLVLSEESQTFTCINTHRGLFNYTRLVFGLSSAAAIFQRAMECVLSGMDGVLCFQDDILVTASHRSLHLDRLNEVLKRLEDAGLTVQKNKCEFFKKEISYLGFILDKNGVRKSNEKIKAIIEAPRPCNISQLQSFLGLTNYYRNFVPDASAILSPLYSLLQKNAKWQWTSEQDNAFNTIKKLLASDQVLTHFDQNMKLILTVDASPTGLGAVLSQICSDGVERPISFASRTLSTAEKKYSQIQKEATAIIFGVRRYHQYLYGRADPFILRTDHKPLITIFGPHRGIPEVSANRLQRYAIFLSAYNYTIEYVRSADNSADFLSRASLPPTSESCAATQAQAEDRDCDDRAAYVNFVIEGTLPITLSDLRRETESDQSLAAVIRFVQNGWPNKNNNLRLQPFFNCRFDLSYENGCLMRGHKVVIPESLQNRITNELHSSHFGIVKMKAAARSRFWYPGIDAAIEKLVSSCSVCAQLRPAPPRTPLAPWPYPPHAFYRIHVDFLGPFNNRMYLIITDAYTKWVECYSMTNNFGSKAVIEKLYDLMSRVGVPHTLVSDNGTSFSSREFHEFCTLNGIVHLFSPAYHPSSNGQAESSVKIVKKGLKSIILSSNNNIVVQEKILKFLFDYRNSKNCTTDKSPAELLYGRTLRSRLDLLSPLLLPTPSPTNLTQTVARNQSSQVKHYKSTRRPDFQPNDLVWFKKFSNNKSCWCKGIIKEPIGKVLYSIHVPELNYEVKRHKNQIILRKELIQDVSSHHWNPDALDPINTNVEEGSELPISTLESPSVEHRDIAETQHTDESYECANQGPAPNDATPGSTSDSVSTTDTHAPSPGPRLRRHRPRIDYRDLF